MPNSTVVHLSLQVLLKIAQHARKGSTTEPLAGQLLGMEQDEKILQVTDCFPFFPLTTALTDEAELETYQLEMLKCLRDVNVDHSTVGWYQVSRFEGGIGLAAFLEAQANYQSTIPCSIALVYDAGLGSLGLGGGGVPRVRALRLKPAVLAHLTEGKRWVEESLDEREIFDELPIVYSLSSLDELLTLQLAQEKRLPPAGPLASAACGLQGKKAALYQLIENLLVGLDDHLGESGRLQHYYRAVHKASQMHGIQKMRRVKGAAAAQEEEDTTTTTTTHPVLLVKNATEPSMVALRSTLLHLQSLSKVCKELQGQLQLAQQLSLSTIVNQ